MYCMLSVNSAVILFEYTESVFLLQLQLLKSLGPIQPEDPVCSLAVILRSGVHFSAPACLLFTRGPNFVLVSASYSKLTQIAGF